ncbi:single-strand binding protein [Caldicellulosiruptor kronotskyensis 2002]|uniref:Single-stranded DNA-binding protein n=1 Tax=Caldicellulosiruptor kronotskyensis (strain DSM 18902 / VKM B-2412 / 2002) TaxID=632348 RepID=E4SET6_CALK2|nr:single-stranded DNA-binding protein [Caldicellulosiruptor kronotskyensis]ADQ45573.1 single-strand binding protein [Caldicellulosiruptor kronotskyensis 2002]
MNKCLFFGRLTKDPEVFTTQNGNKLVRITIAMDRTVKGEKKTQFIPCIAFGKNAELIEQHYNKGREILVEARAENARGKTKDGVEYPTFRFVIERFWFAGSKLKQQHEQTAVAETVESEISEDELEKELEEFFEEDTNFEPPVENGVITAEEDLPF